MSEIEKAKVEDQLSREIDTIEFKETYNQLKKAQRLKPKHFLIPDKEELVSMLQDVVKDTTTLLFNLENNLDEYKHKNQMERFCRRQSTVYFKDDTFYNESEYNFKTFKKTYSILSNMETLRLYHFHRVYDTATLVNELKVTVQHLTTLLLKLESNIMDSD